MKKLWILLPLLLLCGCRQEVGEEAGKYQVYFSALNSQTAALAVDCEARTVNPDASPVSELMKILLAGPEDPALTSPFPDGVRLLDWDVDQDGCLHLNLSEQYGGLTGAELTLADACLVLTLTQVEGIQSVYVTVEGDEIPYRPIQQLGLEHIFSGGSDAGS